MNINPDLNDEAILEELGKRLTQRRIELALTQQELAEQAGIGKRTLERLEAGASVQISNFIRVLRKLDLLDVLGSLLPETGPRPMDLLKLHGKTRKRASSPRKKYKDNPDTKWAWVSEP